MSLQNYNQHLLEALQSGAFESFDIGKGDQVQEANRMMPTGYQGVPGAIPSNTYRGEISFRVTRATSRINAPLPIPFGSAFSYAQNYIQVLQQLAPTGATLVSCTPSVANNNIVIVYGSSADLSVTDTVTIYGDTYNLIAFNQGLYTRKAVTSVVRFTVPDVSAITTAVPQTPARPFLTTWLSNTSVDRNTMSLSPGQYNKNVFDITSPMEISEERGMALYTIADTANPTTSRDYSVQLFFSVMQKN